MSVAASASTDPTERSMPPEIDDRRHPDGQDPLLGDLPQDVGEVPDVEEDGPPAPDRREHDRQQEDRREAEEPL